METSISNLQKTYKQRLATIIKNVDGNIIDNWKDTVAFCVSRKALNTQKGYLNSFIVLLRAIDDNKLADKIGKIRDKLNKKITKNQKNQVISESRVGNQLPWHKLFAKSKEYQLLYNHHHNNNEYNLFNLILHLYIVIPPVRSEPLDMKIYNENPKLTDENYIFRKKNIYYYQINKDKIVNWVGTSTIRLPKKTSILIDRSLSDFPRDFLITPVNFSNRPLSYVQFRKYMIKIFDGKNISIDIFRSAYLTHHTIGLNINQIEKLAKKMRTNYKTIVMNYIKIPRNKKQREYRKKKKENDKENEKNKKEFMNNVFEAIYNKDEEFLKKL
jgi:hypothetical protein